MGLVSEVEGLEGGASGGDQSAQVGKVVTLLAEVLGRISVEPVSADDAKEDGEAKVSAAGEAAMAEAKEAVSVLVRDGVALGVSRPVLKVLANELGKLGKPALEALAQHVLDAVKERRSAFEEAETRTRQVLGEALANSDDFVLAARVLSAIDLESEKYADAEKVEGYVRIAELFLEENEAVDAETFVNRASQYVSAGTDPLVRVRHQVSYARVLDSKRKFLDAGHRFYALSTEATQFDGKAVNEDDLRHLLAKAVTCGILATAGPQRTRLLSLLMKDQRAPSLPTHWPVLESMTLERIVSKAEVLAFEALLEDHQRAILADGSSVLERAVLEHNILASRKIYVNISLKELGALLDVAPERAEALSSRMIKEKRMKGSIDQVDGALHFDANPDVLLHFDAQIQDLCVSVNGVLDEIEKMHPSFSAAAA